MNTTPLGQSDTPRCDEAEKWTNDAGRMVSLKFAEGLERELSQLRANLERLAAWMYPDACDGWTAPMPSDCVRRVLAGETPPEPGQEWPAVPDALDPSDPNAIMVVSEQGLKQAYGVKQPGWVDLALLDVHAGGPDTLPTARFQEAARVLTGMGEPLLPRPTTSGEFDALATRK